MITGVSEGQLIDEYCRESMQMFGLRLIFSGSPDYTQLEPFRQ